MKKLYLTNDELKRNAREAYAAGLLGFQDRGACCTNACRYRYGNAKGSRCAIGASIPDELMPHVVEGSAASLQRLIDWEDVTFADDLQELHDLIVTYLFGAYEASTERSHRKHLDEANAALAKFLAIVEWQGEAPKPLTIAWRGVD